VGEGQADVGPDVLEELDVPLVERVLAVGLQREQRDGPVALRDRDPDERAGGDPAVLARSRDDEQGLVADDAFLGGPPPVLERPVPRRAPDEYRAAGLVRLARGPASSSGTPSMGRSTPESY